MLVEVSAEERSAVALERLTARAVAAIAANTPGWATARRSPRRPRPRARGVEAAEPCPFELSQTSLTASPRGVAAGALAGKFLEEIDADGSQTLDLEEFEEHALVACRKFMPELLEEN
ncbi:hypothetical protein THAOC_01357 [Thalassiosira oceanica]|uniref:EF-hand domain-containing protein n=1 Tax=Thalassiosira oceanica TaxID=159749 RepID=K0TQY5_THAOC|nr:hypothetical protein THAOC_01357 [Thalassiosira oceanica]|eukprot:EJK76857.1 hypothetical protein THAOC_01357 [Thalassiosira oceanica]